MGVYPTDMYRKNLLPKVSATGGFNILSAISGPFVYRNCAREEDTRTLRR